MENGRKKEFKFNIIDIILILVIIIAAAALVYILAGNNLFAGSENLTIIYTIEIPQIKNELITSINQIQTGTKITDSVRSYQIGEIQQVKIEDYFTNSTDMEKGIVVRKPYPDFSKVTMTIKAKCTKDKSGYSVNGKVIMVGVRVDFRTPYFVSYGNCTAVEELAGG